MRFNNIIRRLSKKCLTPTTTARNIPEIKCPPNAKVTVCGCRSLLSQAVLLDLKLSPLLDEIRVFDKRSSAREICEDLNHIASDSIARPFYGECLLGPCLKDVDVIVLAGGHYGSPGEKKHSLFKQNLPKLLDISFEIAHHNPTAAIVVLTPPGSRNVPMLAELYEKIGIPGTSLVMSPMYHYEMIASKLVAETLRLPDNVVSLPVIGGCCPDTVTPIFSNASPIHAFSEEEFDKMADALQREYDRVSELQEGDAPVLALAVAASKLILDIVRGRFDMSQKAQSVFMRSDVLPNVKYLGTPVEFGPGGLKKRQPMPQLSEYEFKHLARSIMILQEDSRIGAAAAHSRWGDIY